MAAVLKGWLSAAFVLLVWGVAPKAAVIGKSQRGKMNERRIADSKPESRDKSRDKVLRLCADNPT